MSRKSPNALLVFPKFNPNSFWNLQAVCDSLGRALPGAAARPDHGRRVAAVVVESAVSSTAMRRS